MSIVLESVTKRYGRQVVINDISLEVRDGEFFVLLGSSGSGKTTVLNIIAGLVDADQGRVKLHGREVTHLPPQDRNVGFVFQNYALFQYMNIAENIEFGLKVRKVPRADRQRKRDELLDLVGLVGLGNAMPKQLSGGQQQRVALARALALEPDVLLLDEPLGALDAKIRVELRRTLKSIQRKLGVAAILVTHDQEEAFDLGDRIGVMSFGRLIEVGTPQELYQFPQTEFVATFLGTSNLLLGQANSHQVIIGSQHFDLPVNERGLINGDRLQVLFRPEDVDLAPSQQKLDCPLLGKGVVVESGFNGPVEKLRLKMPAIPGVRPIAPQVTYGSEDIFVEVTRPPEEGKSFPLRVGDAAWIGIRRMHGLSHPGLSFMLVTDGSAHSDAVLSLGGYFSRMAHARVTLLGTAQDGDSIQTHLRAARKCLGSGMAAINTLADSRSDFKAIEEATKQEPVDVVFWGWRPAEGVGKIERTLLDGDYHLMLATRTQDQIQKALVCASGGEPGKVDVQFAGRLLRHLSVPVSLLTVVSDSQKNSFQRQRAQRFVEEGVQTLSLFGINAQPMIRSGDAVRVILKEVVDGEYDLVVMGMAFPGPDGRIRLSGVLGDVLQANLACSFLLVRSNALYANLPQTR